MTPESLTATLRGSHGLLNGAVERVVLEPRETIGLGAEFCIAHVTYSQVEDLPDRFFVKRSKISDRGQSEVDFYELAAREATGLPLPRFFGAVDERADEPLNMLFEDYSESHTQTPWPLVPTLECCRAAVAALARIHRNWWGRTADLSHSPLAPGIHQARELGEHFPDFADFLGSTLSRAQWVLYERLLADLDGLISERLGNNNATLLHTDPHFWNFLYARPSAGSEAMECVIFDWPLWRTGLAGSDLAYLLALHLYADHRRRFEPELLNHYCAVMNEERVVRSAEDVRQDYRSGVLVGLLMPIQEFAWGIAPHDWLPKLEKAWAAFADLECEELL